MWVEALKGDWCGWRDSNPHAFRAADFESAASTIPPHPRGLHCVISRKELAAKSLNIREETWCRQRILKSRPPAYKTGALPLSYTGILSKVKMVSLCRRAKTKFSLFVTRKIFSRSMIGGNMEPSGRGWFEALIGKMVLAEIRQLLLLRLAKACRPPNGNPRCRSGFSSWRVSFRLDKKHLR